MNNGTADLQTLAADLAATEADIVSTAEYIASANETLATLIGKKYKLRCAHNAASDVMLRLPLEIVTRIFALAIDYQPGQMPPQLVIGHVCTRWRQIVCSTPTLWRDLRILLVRERFKQQQELILEWMKRTAECTLLICIVIHGGITNMNLRRAWDPPVRFYQHLLEYCHRWESFELRVDTLSTNFQGLLDTGAYHFPQLKHIMLPGPSQPPSLSGFWLYKRKVTWELNRPPQLESVFIKSRAHVSMNIDWASIKHFSANMSFLPAIQLINMCSAQALTSLTLGLSTDSQEMENFGFHFVAPNVRTIRLGGLADDIKVMLDMLTVPALVQLDVLVDDGQPHSAHYNWAASLLEMAGRSKFKIAVLRFWLGWTVIDDNQLLDLLSAMPFLEELLIFNSHGPPLSDAILRRLALPDPPLGDGTVSETEAQRTREKPLLYLNDFHYEGP
ncbi:hypothetical protein CPC08DRAFT_710923 [Agrocybe pediades]|nr:hypothetical protein CPC08DRAFT_710923 [Agrocybe pediades]